MAKMRQLNIIIQDTGGVNFTVYLGGDKERIGKVPQDELTPAELWGAKLFNLCILQLREAEMVKGEENMSKGVH